MSASLLTGGVIADAEVIDQIKGEGTTATVNISNPAQLLRCLRSAPARIEDGGHRVLDRTRLRVNRVWRGDVCISSVRNVSDAPINVSNIVLFDLASHGLSPQTPIYGEAFQMLSQTTGTLGAPADMSYTDRAHYKIAEPDGMRTAYGALTLDFGAEGTVLLGFSSCRRFVGRISWDAKSLRISVDPEGLELARGELWKLEQVVAFSGNNRDALFERLSRAINANHPRLPLEKVPTGWCSWYCYGPGAKRTDIHENLVAYARDVPEMRYLQIDDGYAPREGDWLDPNPTFGDMVTLTTEIRATGFSPAMWVAPFIAERESRVLREHPDWFVKDESGNPLDSSTVGFGGWYHGPWYVLDGTNPAAQQHLETLFRTMREEWGVRYFKLDANYWGAIHGGRFFDAKATRVEAYRRGMEAVVRGAGPGAVILGCNAPMWPSIGLVNAMRTSNDIQRTWRAVSGTARENLLRAWQNGRLWANDPDVICLTENGAEMDANLRSFHATAIHAVGGLMLGGDKAVDMNATSRRYLHKLMAFTGKSAVFESTRFEVGVTTVGDTQYFHCFNWDETPADRTIHLARRSRLQNGWTDEELGVHDGQYVVKALTGKSAVLIVGVNDA